MSSRKIIHKHLSSSVLMKVMNELETHPITTIYWSPIDDSSFDSVQKNIKDVKTMLDLSVIRQKLYDGEYTTLESWYNDCISVFKDYNLFFNEKSLQIDVSRYCIDLFNKIAIANNVNLINEWSNAIYKIRSKLIKLHDSIPPKLQVRNAMKTRKPKSQSFDKCNQIHLIKQAFDSFNNPRDWIKSTLILYKHGYTDGKKKIDIDLMALDNETINEIYNDLKERSLILEDDETSTDE
ncbi:hypothetical protein M9Y10_004336 [Tritrichomonas musculus]|uniref:Bromo domain-containing protein n=1 Tax=Tritrichomonas musculus TaxID=1915356 RepID=A0ABR2JS66_9EUKA